MIPTIAAEDAARALQAGDTISLDVRSVSEYTSGHIEGASNIDFYGHHFEEELKKLDLGKKYIVNCLSGGRSGKTVELMQKLGFKNVQNLSGGITAWRNKNLPVV